MNVGKVPETVLKRSIFKQIRHRRNEVLLRPNIGRDCALIGIGEEAIAVSSDPITGSTNEIGKLAVYSTSNDIAASGADLIGILLTILLPDQARESDLKDIMKEIEEVCLELNAEVIGGHTEVTKAVNQPIITVTGLGKLLVKDIMKPSEVKEGQEILITKFIGLEGTSILADAREDELKLRFTGDFIDRSKEFIQYISIVKEAAIGKRIGVTAMHDVTEGGIFGALWELGEAVKSGIEVDLKNIPLRQETVEICEFYDINPYLLISGGSLLMVTDNGNQLLKALNQEGISASIIGRITKSRERIVWNGDEKRYLEPPKSDELYKVIGISDVTP